MKLSKFFCPWCEGVRLEFRDVSESAPNGAGSAQLRGIVLGCPLASVTNCPDATGACESEEEAERHAATQCKTHPTPAAEVSGLYADRCAEWLASASPKAVEALTREADPQPIYVFRLRDCFPVECSYAADNGDAALALLQADLESVLGAPDALASMEMMDTLAPEGRAPEVEAIGFAELRKFIRSWETDPTTDLHCDKVYPQHDDFLRAHQQLVEDRWEVERQDREKREQEALQARADAEGVPLAVMALIERQAGRIELLERGVRALIDGDRESAHAILDRLA